MIEQLKQEDFEKLVNLKEAQNKVQHILTRLKKPEDQIQFFTRYASWNGYFGSGVASLAGFVGRSRDVFQDPHSKHPALADRSVYVASYLFDAARDEFNDRATSFRDTHRCLAQSFITGLIDFHQIGDKLIHVDPAWLQRLNTGVAKGYGVGAEELDTAIFEAIGYHIGSELLADTEFTSIDGWIKNFHPIMHQFLTTRSYYIAGAQPHNAYQWISIHSSLSAESGGAEADHFKWATKGANYALHFTPFGRRGILMNSLKLGFLSFARDHDTFFTQVML